jgi:regulator-associated protein of mTOR
MVSAFRGLNELVQVRQGAGVVLDWTQSSGLLFVGGDSRIIKIWDAQTETPTLVRHRSLAAFSFHISISTQDFDTNSESPVTAIVCDAGPSQLFAASFANGEVKIFDRRLEEENSVVRNYVDHESWVQNVRCDPTTQSQFLSARYVVSHLTLTVAPNVTLVWMARSSCGIFEALTSPR